MDKLSIVIPTMQKNTRVLDMLISQLDKNEYIGEIIIIDNSLKGYIYNSDKLSVHIPDKNMYVNPSWNFGVSLAKSNYIGILNDDLLLSDNICEQVLNFIKSSTEIGLVGIESGTVIDDKLRDFDTYPQCSSDIIFKPINNIRTDKNYYWGSAIFGRKENFYVIPEDILVYCGDDYLLYMNAKNNKTNYAFSNTEIKHCHALTSASPEFLKIKENDKIAYAKIDYEFKKFLQRKQFCNFIQQIFSIQNSTDKTHKILTLFGLKIKIKRKSKSK